MSVRNELRIGWGDMLYEQAMYHNSNSTNRYRYTGHIFVEYQYYFRPWFSLGVQADYEQVWWDVTRVGTQPLPEPSKDHSFYNACLMPAMRFSYCHKPHVNLYSALMFGVGVNGGTETDMYGRTLAWTPAWGFTLLGLKAGGKHCFVSVDILPRLLIADVRHLLAHRNKRIRLPCYRRAQFYLYARFAYVLSLCRLQFLTI